MAPRLRYLAVVALLWCGMVAFVVITFGVVHQAAHTPAKTAHGGLVRPSLPRATVQTSRPLLDQATPWQGEGPPTEASGASGMRSAVNKVVMSCSKPASLPVGQTLFSGERLIGKQHFAVLQDDGNFVVYATTDGAVIWASASAGGYAVDTGGNYHLRLDTTNVTLWTGEKLVWQIIPSSRDQLACLSVGSDGSLLLRSVTGRTVWDSGLSIRDQFLNYTELGLLRGDNLKLKFPRVRIQVMTPHYFGSDFETVELCPQLPQLLSCEFSTAFTDMPHARWYHAPHIVNVESVQAGGVPAIVYSMESEANYPVQATASGLDGVLLATPRLDSDVPIIYGSWVRYGDFRRPPIPWAEKKRALLYVQSNCIAWRDDYVQRLMQVMRVDAPGKCLHNIEWADVDPTYDPKAHTDSVKQSASAHYMFTLAFENSVSTDYVTERFYQPLAVGSVPVVRGAPNARSFAPADDAIVLAEDYDSPEMLGQYLLNLTESEEQYQKLLEWKTQPFSVEWRRLMALGGLHGGVRCRLCAKVAHGCSKDCHCGGRLH